MVLFASNGFVLIYCAAKFNYFHEWLGQRIKTLNRRPLYNCIVYLLLLEMTMGGSEQVFQYPSTL